MTEITNTDDIIDSRDVITRIAELQAALQGDSDYDGRPLSDDEADELRALCALAEEASGYAPDWEYGEVLIRDSYFVAYAEELAIDVGAYDPSKYEWPLSCIDWDRAARELQMDYTAVEFDGVTYWVR